MHLVQSSVGSALGIHWRTALPNVPLIRGETLDLSHHQGNGIIPSGYWKSPLEDTPFGLAVLPLQQPLMQTTDCGQPNDCLHHALWLWTPSEAAPARSPPPFYTAMWAAEIRVWGCFCVRKRAFSFSLWPWTLSGNTSPLILFREILSLLKMMANLPSSAWEWAKTVPLKLSEN